VLREPFDESIHRRNALGIGAWYCFAQRAICRSM
jgi:hypothetical protein